MNKIPKKAVLTAVAIAVALLIIVGIVAMLRLGTGSGEADPYSETEVTNQVREEATVDDSAETTPAPDSDTSTESESSLDPATVSTIVIEPLGIEVAYVKGIEGFSYAVSGTPNGTQSVEFQNESLKGTKCTDDNGTFAAITKNPSTAEQQTLAKKKTVDGVVYGLSLSATTCTSDPELLKQYQTSFEQAFPLLKRSTS